MRESLGITHQVAFAAVVAALTADANVLADRLTLDQRKELGTAPPVTPEDEAMWDTDERAREWAREKQRELNEMARYALPEQQRQMATEMRDD